MGCGHVADFGHLPALTRTPGLELVALFDPVAENVHRLATKFGVPAAHTDQAAFLNEGLDAVVVASPPAYHPANAVAAAKAGVKVILCEKPLAESEEEARDMIDAVRGAGAQIYTGFVYRYSPVAEQIRQWVREGVVGEVRSIRLVYLWNLHGQFEEVDGKWIESPRWRGRMLEGGPLVDCGVHQIDLARWWLGSEVVRSTGIGAWVSDYEAPDHAFLHLDHAGGAHTSVEVSFTYGHTVRDPRSIFTYELIGTGGVIRYDRDGYVLEARQGSGTISVPGASEKNFDGMHAALVRALDGEGAALPSAEDGLEATRIAEEATETAIAANNKKRMQKTRQMR
jgi:predicted dehydrogenase